MLVDVDVTYMIYFIIILTKMLHRNICRFTGVVFLYLLFSSLIDSVDTSKILFFNGMGEGSHFSTAAVLGEELASRGHFVTFLISNEFEHLAENPELSAYSEFIIIETRVRMTPYYKQVTQAQFDGVDLYRNKTFFNEINEARTRECSVVFSSKFLEKLKNHQFDLVVFDPWWPCCIALGDILKTKKVAFNPASFSPVFLRAFGLHINSALIAEEGTGFPEKMNFFQRFHNVLLSHSVPWVSGHAPLNDALATEEYSPLVTLLQENQINSHMKGLSSTDLFVSTSHSLLYPDIPETAGHVSVAGLTVKKALPLAEDLETFMQSSGGHGIIIFSVGTYATHLPERFVTVFREVFSKLPHKVIWQWKGDHPPNMTENVKLMSWLPQNDLLGHDKTKLLIYQGGNNGLHEAIYHAVPLLVIPLGGDQFDIAHKVAEKGIGMKIAVTSLTVESLHNAITTITSDSGYQERVNRMSTIFRDHPLSPRQKAVYWIEHILKYGSKHLHSASKELHGLQKNLVDIYVFIFCILCLIIMAGGLIWKCILNARSLSHSIDKTKRD